MSDYLEPDAEFIMPPNKLKDKVGRGGFPKDVVIKCDAFIQNNEIDFAPYGYEYLEKIKTILDLAQNTRSVNSQFDYLDEISHHVMQLKASGSMFGFQAVTKIADTVLTFIESVEEINDDLFKIMAGHNACLELIFKKNIRGDNIKEIDVFTAELYDAIIRYNKKYGK